MIKFSATGDWSKTTDFLKNFKMSKLESFLRPYGQRGIEALRAATPVRSGETAASWSCDIQVTPSKITLSWSNSNKPYGAPVALLIQYGHGTRNGGYVQGIDYINPAIRPIFDEIENAILREVSHI